MSAWGQTWAGSWAGSWGSVNALVETDEALQDLLDPGENLQGVLLVRRMDATVVSSYYCIPILVSPGRSRWVDVRTSWTNAQKAASILSQLEIPAQPDSSLIG